MKKNAVLSFAALLSAAALFLSSCSDLTVGLGEELDLDAPVLKITYPVIRSGEVTYVGREFTMTGTCTDNKKVARVVVEYWYTDGGAERTGSQNAVISGETWSSFLSFSADTEAEITVTAYDDMDNTSENSVASVTVVVDADTPNAKEFFISRNGGQVNLMDLAYLEEIAATGLSESSNKDYFQNEKFSLTATLNDNNEIQGAVLSLYSSGGARVLSDLPTDESDNPYKPVWTVTEAMLTAASPEYAAGAHYLRPVITATDGAGNSYSSEGKYLCWYPESDTPKVILPLENGGAITVSRITEIPVNVFDDDGIALIYCGLVPYSEWEKLKAGAGSDDDAFQSLINDGTLTSVPPDGSETGGTNTTVRDCNFSLSSGDTAGRYCLAVAVEDQKTDGQQKGVWTYTAVPTFVDSSDCPIIVVSAPSENTSAELTYNSFTISGFTLDDKAVSKMAVAWLPGDSADLDTALNLLAAYVNDSGYASITPSASTSEKADTTSVKTDDATGIKIFRPEVTVSNTMDATYKKYKDTFKRSFNVLTDFKVNNQTVNESKLFVIYVQDQEGNVTYKTFRLGAYTADPSVTVEYGESAGSFTDFSDALITYGRTGKIYFRVTPAGANGLGIKSFSGTYTDSNSNGTSAAIAFDSGSPDAEGWYTFSMDSISGGQLVLTFTAQDALGNSASDRKTVVFAEKPALVSVTANHKTGEQLIKGSVLTLQANFSTNVSVSSGETVPYIALKNIVNDTGAKAVYVRGSGTDTLVFTYTVPDGAYTKEKSYVAIADEDPVTDTGKKIQGTITLGKDANSEIEKCQIAIDAVPPSLVTANCVPAMNGIVSGNTVTLAFSEAIYLESGTVTVRPAEGWAIPPVLDNTTFKEIYNSLGSADKTTLIGSSTGEPALLDDAGTPAGPYKKITHGLNLKGDYAVPDTETQYVLAFDYGTEENLDIFSTTGIVGKIREILEKYGYRSAEFDISECTTDDNKLTVTLDNGFLADGIKYEVTVSAGAVRDSAGNTNAEIKRGAYTFWTGTVATPVIRTDRYTHGAGIREPKADGTNGSTLSDSTAFSTPPTGYVRVKIDCETPDAVITYGTATLTSETIGTAAALADTGSSTIEGITVPVSGKAGDTVTISLTVTGASNYKQMGLQTELDWYSSWNEPGWQESGLDDPLSYSVDVTSNSDFSSVVFKLMFQYTIGSQDSTITVTNIKATVNGTSGTASDITRKVFNYGKTANIRLDDAAKSVVEGISATTPYGGIFALGSGSFESSNKYYIKAQATFGTAKDDQPAMTASGAGYEGAYRTLIVSHNPVATISESQPIYVQGSCSEGEPLIAGFPMRDANPDMRYSRCMYQKTDGGNTDYILISYDIVSWFRMQTYVTNWSKEEDKNCYYGGVIYNTGREFW